MDVVDSFSAKISNGPPTFLYTKLMLASQMKSVLHSLSAIFAYYVLPVRRPEQIDYCKNSNVDRQFVGQ